jgi:SAM-dependent methyltransferase
MSAYAEELFTPSAAHADEFAQAALNAIQKLPAGSRVLDIGCGSGDLIRRAQRHGISFVGVDISHPNIEAAKANCHHAEFHCADFLSFDGGRFDVVLANSVFHLLDCSDERLINNLLKATQKRSAVIAAMPVWSIKNRLLSLQRQIMKFAPSAFDNLLIQAAALVLSDTSRIRERLVYLRMPPTRLLNRRFIRSMEIDGFSLSSATSMGAKHPFKLGHSIVVWHRH